LIEMWMLIGLLIALDVADNWILHFNWH